MHAGAGFGFPDEFPFRPGSATRARGIVAGRAMPGVFCSFLFTTPHGVCGAVEKTRPHRGCQDPRTGGERHPRHDYPLPVRLCKVLFERYNLGSAVRVETHFGGSPADDRSLEDAETVVLISDGRDETIGEEAPHLATQERQNRMAHLIQKACGLVPFHFSVFALEAFEERVLRWSGGYFQWDTGGQRKWYSAIKVAEHDLFRPISTAHTSRGASAAENDTCNLSLN
jgi:hypothetical protein